MRSIRKRTIVTAGLASLLLVGAGSAIAAGQAGPPFAPFPGLHQPGTGGGMGLMAGGVVMDAAAEYIGISETALQIARHDGQSLAQIAVANGKTAAGLKQALVTAFKANLDSLVASGKITSVQATQTLATFQAQVQTMIDRTATGPFGACGAGMGMGQGFGQGFGHGGGMR
jgi:hypothetical protein